MRTPGRHTATRERSCRTEKNGPISRNRRHRPNPPPPPLCLSPAAGRESDARLCRDPSLVARTEKGDQEDGEDRVSPVEVTRCMLDGYAPPCILTQLPRGLGKRVTPKTGETHRFNSPRCHGPRSEREE
nr:hypothetical protein Iba_chr14dCG1530 [Ipomoea batatas]